ncbi:hypothetical protein H206_06970 [Candidatus Electrothrix aarhusensis]|uniref:Uncharacterized protein n=1 Tax=Candidatus Electrothrix aarhusensis TaxID=1859131 RepID=A0A3S3R192_9BACT|nr:hypothetical protein H206_06970 [Candidatus Electrothrix aarhusensis]
MSQWYESPIKTAKSMLAISKIIKVSWPMREKRNAWM